MGLDTSHDCWRGAYSAFTRWRHGLARAAGYSVLDVKYDTITMPTVMMDWGHFASENPGHLVGEWSRIPDDPLVILLAHSDCDGVIRHQHAAILADRIEELLPLLPEQEDTGHIGDWRKKTQRFIDGLRLAASRGEDVEFH